MRLFNGVDENFQHDFVVSTVLVITSQKLVSQIGLVLPVPYESNHNNRHIFYDKNGVDFFHEHHCKVSCKEVVDLRYVGLKTFSILKSEMQFKNLQLTVT